MKRRIAITGVGVISPIGIGLPVFWESLKTCRSGIDFISSYPTGDFPVNFAAEIKDFKATDFVPRKAIKVMARDIQLAVAAARLAFDDSGLEKNPLLPERLGVNLGAGLINADINELGVVAGHSLSPSGRFDIKKFGEEGIRELAPLWLLKQLPNMLSSHVSIIYNAQAPSNSITTGCSSSLLAIGESRRVMERDQADAVLSGGADSRINPLSLLRFHLLKMLARGWTKPSQASRPFDKNRNGLVVGEGAGVIVLEELSRARARGARLYAELIGFGSSFSNRENSQESIAGKIQAMQAALNDAGIKREEVGLISAHGISTLRDDLEEREAIQGLFGERAGAIPVTAPKSMLGYAGAACGVLGLIAALLAIKEGVIPANPNYLERDTGDSLDHVSGHPRSQEINCAMVNAFGLGGQNGVIIVRKPC